MQNEKNEKLTQTIRWTRQRIKEVYPLGGHGMTAALNLWHILRGTPIRHGSRFDYLWSYRHSVTYLLRQALDAGMVTPEQRIELWDKLVDIPVSRVPESAGEYSYWKRMPTHYLHTKENPTPPAQPKTVNKTEEPEKKSFLQRWLKLG